MQHIRLMIFGMPGVPIFELGEKLSDFHKMDYFTIEDEVEFENSFFRDKIPSKHLDTGDFVSGSGSSHMSRDITSKEKDRELDSIFVPNVDTELDADELAELQDELSGILVTEIPDTDLIEWATHIIFIKADWDKAVEWFSKRRKCPTCGNVHHLDDKPPRYAGICDRCGTSLIIKPEDKPEVVANIYQNWRKAFSVFQMKCKRKKYWKTISLDDCKDFNELLTKAEKWLKKTAFKPIPIHNPPRTDHTRTYKAEKTSWYKKSNRNLMKKSILNIDGVRPELWKVMSKILSENYDEHYEPEEIETMFENAISDYAESLGYTHDGEEIPDFQVPNIKDINIKEPEIYQYLPYGFEYAFQEAWDSFSKPKWEYKDQDILNKIKPFEEEIYEELKSEYGSTYNWKVSGYVLPDGTALDFSEGGNIRSLDHRDVAGTLKDYVHIESTEQGDSTRYKNLLIALGAMLIIPEINSVVLIEPPTKEQKEWIKKIFNSTGEVNISIMSDQTLIIKDKDELNEILNNI